MYEFPVYVRIVYVFYLVEARVKFLKIRLWLKSAHNPLVLQCYATLGATLLVVATKNRKCEEKMTSLRTQVLRGTSRRIPTQEQYEKHDSELRNNKNKHHHGAQIAESSCTGIQNQPPSHGNLFTMGLLRAHTKGFTLLLDWAKKIIYLLRASIYFYFYFYFTRSPWKRSNHAPPHAPRRSHIIFHPPPIERARFLLIVASFIPCLIAI